MLGLDKKFVRAKGSYIWTNKETVTLIFLSGYGALSLGHNHPRVLEAIKKVEDFPNILQVSLNVLAGGLARKHRGYNTG